MSRQVLAFIATVVAALAVAPCALGENVFALTLVGPT